MATPGTVWEFHAIRRRPAFEIHGYHEWRTSRDYPDFPQPGRFGRTLVWGADALRAWRQRHPSRSRDN